MNKTLFTIPLVLMGMLLVLSGTAIAHEGEEHDKGMYEEGSGGSAMEMDIPKNIMKRSTANMSMKNKG